MFTHNVANNMDATKLQGAFGKAIDPAREVTRPGFADIVARSVCEEMLGTRSFGVYDFMVYVAYGVYYWGIVPRIARMDASEALHHKLR